ncbi:MAG: long-chain-fatty-acid--CoA ligase [Deferribacteraceae bacterium]|jgi:long-chain acyl-CoA synthetase|nr:long-chain-fatty-acid--CoA ligase [Deferribacteraceae bacterium]
MAERNDLFEILNANVIENPKKKYIFFKKDVYTYRQTIDIVENAAMVMSQNGVKKGDRVGLLMGSTPEFIFAFYAIMRLGAIAIPINVFLKAREIGNNLADCEADSIITSNQFAEVVPHLAEFDPHLAKIFSFDKETTFPSVNLYQRATVNSRDVVVSRDKDDVALLVYTSGTTGKPKGVMLTHANILANARPIKGLIDIVPKDRFLSVLPMFHSFAFTVNVISPAYCGASIVILESVMEMKTKEYKKMLLLKRPTIIAGVPQIYAAMAKMEINFFQRLVFPFRAIVSGGASLPGETMRRFYQNFGKPVIEGYGLSEASPVISFNPPYKQKAGSVGLPLTGVEVKVVNDEGELCKPNEPGELCARGANVMKGYWNQPAETARTIVDGWLHTGDVAVLDEEGFITIVDRIKDLIIAKGINVYPSEIEELLHVYQGVGTVAVVGVPDSDGNETIVAYIIPDETGVIDEKGIKQFAKKNLAAYKLPKYYITVKELPMTGTGKVLKKELRVQAKADLAKMKGE